MTRDIPDDRKFHRRKPRDSWQQRLLRMVKALQVGAHTRIGRARDGIEPATLSHCRDVRRRRDAILNLRLC